MANQVATQPYSIAILGDGVATTVSFNLKNIPDSSNDDKLELSNPDSIYLQNFVGSPLPLPNITSLTVSGTVVSINFDVALTTFDPLTQNGLYNISFFLGFNA